MTKKGEMLGCCFPSEDPVVAKGIKVIKAHAKKVWKKWGTANELDCHIERLFSGPCEFPGLSKGKECCFFQKGTRSCIRDIFPPQHRTMGSRAKAKLRVICCAKQENNDGSLKCPQGYKLAYPQVVILE